MDLDEESIILLALLTPIPFLVLAFKFFSTEYSFLIGLVYYVAASVGIPVYLSSRAQAVYSKASLIAWLKIAGVQNFTPKEQEIIRKALGKETVEPIRETKSTVKKNWKFIFVASVLTLSVILFLIPTPTPASQIKTESREYVDIEILEHYLELPLNITPQYLTLTLKINTTVSLYMSSCKVLLDNRTIGMRTLGENVYASNYITFSIRLDAKINETDSIFVQLKVYPEKYSINKMYAYKELIP
jgi:hypothetical protein